MNHIYARILDYRADHPGCTRPEICRALRVSASTVQRALKQGRELVQAMAKARPVAPGKRLCLRCNRPFTPEHKGNRICPRCTDFNRTVWMP